LKVRNLAIDAARAEKRQAKVPASKAKVERPAAETLRAAVLADCRARVLAATGELFDGFSIKPEDIERERSVAKFACAVLEALDDAPHEITSAVDAARLRSRAGNTPPWHRFLVSHRMCVGYIDANGRYQRYGGTDTELAVLSILSGSWPKVKVGSVTVAQVIEAEATAIRKARTRTR
jgi:hypothetical protein